MNCDDEYVSLQNCKNNGFVRTSCGVCRLTALERAYAKGRLDYGDQRFGRDDRLKAGQYLSRDYEKARFGVLSSGWEQDRVDGRSSADTCSDLIEIRSRYLTAVRQIPHEFWPIVRKVCVENMLPEFDSKLPARRRYEQAYASYCDLCRGLDRLIKFYVAGGKNT